MWYSALKNLRKDKHFLFKVVFTCVVLHFLLCLSMVMHRVMPPPRKMNVRNGALNIVMSGRMKADAPALGVKMPVPKHSAKKEIPKKPENKKASTQIEKPIEKKISSVATIAAPEITAPKQAAKKDNPPKNKVEKTATKAPIEPAKAAIKAPEKKAAAPVKKKEPEAKKVPDKPQLQQETLGFQGPVLAEEKDMPVWFTQTRDAIGRKILDYKFLKDIEEDFTYSALLTLDARGNASISDESGCPIPAVRTLIKKVYLEYYYPQAMWNKIWPIVIAKSNL